MQTHKAALNWIHISFFLLSVPFIILALFAFPAADDYCVANFISENGFFNSQIMLFQQMNGRYLSTFIISVFSIKGLWLYQVGLLCVILLFLGSLIHAEKHLVKGESRITMIALATFLMFFNLFPQIAEVVYWLSGSVSYLLTVSLVIFFIIRFIKTRATETIKISNYLLLIVLQILIGGAHELGLLACMIVLNWFLLFERNSRRQLILITSLLALSISIILFTTFAGAGTERMSYYADASFFEKIKLSILANIKLHVLIFLNIPFLICSFAVLLLARPAKTNPWSFKKTITYSFYIFASITVMIAVHPIFTGLTPPLRIYSFLSVLYIPAILFSIYNLKPYLLAKFNLEGKQRETITIAFSFLFLLSLISGFHKIPGGKVVFTGNVVASITDLAFNAAPYSQEMHQRTTLTINAVNEKADTLILPQISHKPHTLSFLDVSDNQYAWVTLCYQEYFDYHGVILFDDSEKNTGNDRNRYR